MAFDIGGVLSKYPKVFKPLLRSLWIANCQTYHGGELTDVYIISDMHPKEKIWDWLLRNDLDIYIEKDNVYSADYTTHGEKCKAVLCKELGIDILVDDFPGYVADGEHVRLLVMPNTNKSYYHDTWITDGSEGNFGRRIR